MLKYGALLAAGLLLAAGGLVHGLMSDRWGTSAELAGANARLAGVPRAVGPWESEDVSISPRELALSGSTSCLARRYTDRSGESLTVLILCGRPGPVSVHTPDVCYRGLGYEPTGTPARWAAPLEAGGRPASFWTAQMRKEEPARVSQLKFYWSWGAAGTWEAHGNPRVALAHLPALYKLYVIRQAGGEEGPEDDPAVDFLRLFIPELQRALFAQP